MAEAANIPEFDIAPAWGVFLPANTPASIVERLESWSEQSSRWTLPDSFFRAPMPFRSRAARALCSVRAQGDREAAGAGQRRKIEPQ